MEYLPDGSIPSPFQELDDVTPEQLEDCMEFLDNAWLVVTTIRKAQLNLDRVYVVLDKIEARKRARRQ